MEIKFSGNCGKYWGKSATEDNEWEDRTRGNENILPHWWGVYNGKKYYKKTKFMIGLHAYIVLMKGWGMKDEEVS